MRAEGYAKGQGRNSLSGAGTAGHWLGHAEVIDSISIQKSLEL